MTKVERTPLHLLHEGGVATEKHLVPAEVREPPEDDIVQRSLRHVRRGALEYAGRIGDVVVGGRQGRELVHEVQPGRAASAMQHMNRAAVARPECVVQDAPQGGEPSAGFRQHQRCLGFWLIEALAIGAAERDRRANRRRRQPLAYLPALHHADMEFHVAGAWQIGDRVTPGQAVLAE